MKRKIKFAVMLGVLIGTLSACGNDTNTFTVGFDASFPPYGYVSESNEYVGFDLELAAEVCRRQGWEVEYRPIDWDIKDVELASESIDCIWNGFTISEDRKDAYEWTKPYLDSSQVFVTLTGSDILSKNDLSGKSVTVQVASTALEAIESDEKLMSSLGDFIQVPDYDTAFLYLESRTTDVIIVDIGVANYQIGKRKDYSFNILDEALISEQYGVGFLLGNTELRDKVQKSLDEMAEDGTFLEIAKKWGLEDSIVLY